MELFEDDETLVFSTIDAPEFNSRIFKPARVAFPYSQEAKKFILVDGAIDLEKSWDDYIIPLQDLPSPHFTDFFSKRHLREKISTLKLQIFQNDPADVKKRKKDANPYSRLKHVPHEFKYQGIPRMANLLKLYPEIIEKNYVISEYQFLTLGDKGGYSEYIVNQYQKQYLENLSGWALFPKTNFKIEEVQNRTESEINFETIEKFADEVLAFTTEPSLMLIFSDLAWKEKDSNLEEKYMKLYLGYSIYLSVKLLARGGNLVVKLSNTSHPATIEMIYIVASMFNSISLIKLLSSSPHSSVIQK